MKSTALFLTVASILTGCATQPSRPDPVARLADLGVALPAVSAPVANYVNAVRTGNLVWLAGKGPKREDGSNMTGKVGRDLTVEEGHAAARLTGINQLAALEDAIGDLRRVRRVVKVVGFVNCDPTFTDHSRVINGFSDLMVEVFGEAGRHARSSVGAPSLPGNVAVEIELVVEID